MSIQNTVEWSTADNAVTTITPPEEALKKVLSSDGKEVYASADVLFREAFFGRDSLEVAEDLLESNSELCANILIKNASLQGFRFDRKSEEQPGKIAHEHREPPDDVTSKLIFDELKAKWGSYEGKMTYYGSIDATPQFIRVLCGYVQRYGTDILDVEIERRNGERFTMDESLSLAIDWSLGQLNASSSGLFEYERLNRENGIENQVWKDSKEFYVHEDGSIANHDAPIASIEVQGLVYDALLLAGEIHPDKARQYEERADLLRNRTIELLWQKDRAYFALGVDHDEHGNIRQLQTKTANPAALLDTKFFDNLPEAEREEYISGIVRTIMSPDFLTDAGIRSRALSMKHLIPYWDYHGSFVSWPKETIDIAKGLRRQGFERLGIQLENRLINAVTRAGTYPEYIYVDEKSKMLTTILRTRVHEDMMVVESTNKPEALQAWTITAVIHALEALYGDKVTSKSFQTHQQFQLEWEILNDLPEIGHINNQEDLHRQYPVLEAALKEPKSKIDNFYPEHIRQVVAV